MQPAVDPVPVLLVAVILAALGVALVVTAVRKRSGRVQRPIGSTLPKVRSSESMQADRSRI